MKEQNNVPVRIYLGLKSDAKLSIATDAFPGLDGARSVSSLVVPAGWVSSNRASGRPFRLRAVNRPEASFCEVVGELGDFGWSDALSFGSMVILFLKFFQRITF